MVKKVNLKSTIRKKILSLLRSQKEEDRLRKSKVIQKKLFKTREFKEAKVVLFYASFDGEVETFRMMTQAQRLGKKIVLPSISKDQKKLNLSLVSNLKKGLVAGPYGIVEPKRSRSFVHVKSVDLAVVPGIAFDKNNNRLGRGAGYYDRFLSGVSQTTRTFGLAFDFQIFQSLPHKKHDVPVSRVISN